MLMGSVGEAINMETRNTFPIVRNAMCDLLILPVIICVASANLSMLTRAIPLIRNRVKQHTTLCLPSLLVIQNRLLS